MSVGQHNVGSATQPITPGEGDGPYDSGDAPDGLMRRLVDFGSLFVPVPAGVDAQALHRPHERWPGVHILFRGGYLRLHVLAAPRSGSLWDQLSSDVAASLEGQSQVHREQGSWGVEVVSATADGVSRFVGVDGPRWTLYGVATGPASHAAEHASALRAIMRGTVVVRGSEPFPVSSTLPLANPPGEQGPDDEDEAVAPVTLVPQQARPHERSQPNPIQPAAPVSRSISLSPARPTVQPPAPDVPAEPAPAGRTPVEPAAATRAPVEPPSVPRARVEPPVTPAPIRPPVLPPRPPAPESSVPTRPVSTAPPARPVPAGPPTQPVPAVPATQPVPAARPRSIGRWTSPVVPVDPPTIPIRIARVAPQRPDDGRRRLQQRLAVLEAVVAAVHRHREIADVIVYAQDRSGAAAAISALLGVGPIPANAVLDLPWHQLTAERRRAITAERDDLRSYLHAADWNWS